MPLPRNACRVQGLPSPRLPIVPHSSIPSLRSPDRQGSVGQGELAHGRACWTTSRATPWTDQGATRCGAPQGKCGQGVAREGKGDVCERKLGKNEKQVACLICFLVMPCLCGTSWGDVSGHPVGCAGMPYSVVEGVVCWGGRGLCGCMCPRNASCTEQASTPPMHPRNRCNNNQGSRMSLSLPHSTLTLAQASPAPGSGQERLACLAHRLDTPPQLLLLLLRPH